MAAPEGKELEGVLLGMGNPLLDISAEVDADFMKKYGIELNNAALAEESHLPMYEEMVKDYKVGYIAGGATQNSIRVAQWMLQAEGATSFVGSVGEDAFGEQLAKAATTDGVNVMYRVDKEAATGTCAVCVLDKERSLVANLAAANNYEPTHLVSKPVWSAVKKAKYYYMAGFFLTVSPDSAHMVAEHAYAHGKTFAMNISAPFIVDFFWDQLQGLMPFTDILLGNESEFEAYAKKIGAEGKPLTEVAEIIGKAPTKKGSRTVIITQGKDPCIVYHDGKVTLFEVELLPAKDIVDLNGAGDAFVGGFLSQLVRGKSVLEAVPAGHYSARKIVQQEGCSVPKTAPEYAPKSE